MFILESSNNIVTKTININCAATSFSNLSEINNDVNNEVVADDNDENKPSFLEDLRNWALLNRISHSAQNSILNILKNHGFGYLPKDARTLLRTPPVVNTVRMGKSGKFWYHGLENNLK